MAILKLANEGDTATMTVKSCDVVEGQFGAQVKFESDKSDVLFLPKTSADRQLLRCGFDDGTDHDGNDMVDYDAVPGNVLTFARTPNAKKGAKPYWDIAVASSADLKPKAPPKRLAAPTIVPGGEDDPGPPEPPELARKAEERQGNEDDKQQRAKVMTARYLDLYDEVATHLCKVGSDKEFPVDATGINAATATIWINLSSKGLL